jgi:hypothetical protein
VTIDASDEVGGRVDVSGTVAGVSSGSVAIYRERPGASRVLVGRRPLVGGSFSLFDTVTARPVLYRAVYTDPVSGVPYAALLRQPIE